MAERKFERGEQKKYSTEEKHELGQLALRYKADYDAKMKELKDSKAISYNEKRKKHTQRMPAEGYVSRAVRDFYPDLKSKKHNDPQLAAAVKLGKRCYDAALKAEQDEEITTPALKSKYRQPGAGRKRVAPEVRQALYDWFINIRGALHARLPLSLFKAQANQFFEEWFAQQSEEVKAEQTTLVFSNRWLKGWMREFGVSLKTPNKRFQIKQADRVERICEYIKNIWMVRKYYIDNFNVDPPIINGDQMPLHRNETSSQKTLNVKGMDAYVKENYSLSRERVTVFTQVSSDPNMHLKPEFVFKGKGTRSKHVQGPDGIYHQFAEKGSYRLPQMLSTIEHLPNKAHVFTKKDNAIYSLDNYSVHNMPDVKKALLKKGYVAVPIGGGITGDMQVNDTHLHNPLKKTYREKEMQLMQQKLRSDPKKIPAPSKNEMMSMLSESMDSVTVDFPAAFKSLWLTNKLDGSEDYLVSERIMDLVGEEMKKFRDELMTKPGPKSFAAMLKLITPPKGVKLPKESAEVPADEGDELFDCEGDEISVMEINAEVDEYADDLDEESGSTVHAERVDDKAVTETAVDQEDKETSSSSQPLQLASFCQGEELKSDALFVDQMGDLLRTGSNTSTIFLPHLNAFKRQYVDAKRSLKKRIECEKSVTGASTHDEEQDTSTHDEEQDASTHDEEQDAQSDDRNVFDLFNDTL